MGGSWLRLILADSTQHLFMYCFQLLEAADWDVTMGWELTEIPYQRTGLSTCCGTQTGPPAKAGFGEVSTQPPHSGAALLDRTALVK